MPSQPNLDHLRSLKTLPQLIAYLRDELDWPVDQDAVEDDVTFQYAPEELGFDAATAVHIKEIKQLRPLDSRQPWGVFWVNFEKKRLPVVMLRRILGNLVLKKRAAARQASQRAWHMHDLLFISAYGEESDRAITFAHFSQPPDSPGDLPILKVLGWDDGDTVLHLVDAHRTLAEKLRWPPKTTGLDAWRNQWASAFTLRHREVITTTTELVEELARLADATRRRARTILARESERGPLRRLYAAFKAALIHDLTEDDFADVIAQTISYGLLIARFSRDAISAQNLVDMVPASNPFLRELLGTFLALAGRQSAFDFDELGIQDVVEVLNRSNADAVKADFGNRTRDEDPVIHFYEHFLDAYDKKKKIQRGVFYTPQPAVSYIVRSVHELFQKEFGIEDGLASTITWGDILKKHPDLKLPKIRVPKAGKAEGEEADLSPDEFFVLILDIATGTGTFLVETIEVIFQHLQAKWAKHGLQGMPIIRHNALRLPQFKDYWNAYVPAALLPRLYGYELMMAPYTIAHMKLALKFSEINARLGQADYLVKFEGRAHIYLTNTLEPPSGFQTQQFAEFFPALAHEAAAVNAVKRTKCFSVFIGNPPYAYMSANLTEQSRSIIDAYRFVNGEKIVERGALVLERALQDDYVKFFAFAQESLRRTGIGFISIISNSAYLKNPNMRGMRNTFTKDFDYFLGMDLHGDVKSLAEDDQNIFEIRTGVAICLLARSRLENRKPFTFALSELVGSRQRKDVSLAASTLAKDCTVFFVPKPPQFLFDVKTSGDSEYDHWLPISELFPVTSVGIKTNRDDLVIDFADGEIQRRLDFLMDSANSLSQVKEVLGIEDNAQWAVADGRKECRQTFSVKNFKDLAYRPFDTRRIYYHGSVVFNPRPAVMVNLLGPANLALITNRRIRTEDHAHFFVVNKICMAEMLSSADNCNVYPLHLFDGDLVSTSSGRPNFNQPFLKAVASNLGLPQTGDHGLPKGLTPEDIFHYAYGVFHSPDYRSRYAEFLKIDFPRLPLTGNLELFHALARLGGDLVALHLLESPKLKKEYTEFSGNENQEIEKVTFANNTVWIDKEKSTGFMGVRTDVWNFHIGGYQVCEKWLKDRKGRNLTADDRTHYQKIIVALSETIRLMAEIDAVIAQHGGWPLK